MSRRKGVLVALWACIAGPALDASADVDLAKSITPHTPPAWVGQEVGQVLDASRIQRVVLIKALTNTTVDRDLAFVRKVLRESAHVRFLDVSPGPDLLRMGMQDSTWEALIVTDGGEVFGFSADARRVCLSRGDGSHGCFARALPEPG